MNPNAIPCPVCGATYWEKREQHIVNETVTIETNSAMPAGHTTDEDYVESESLTGWYCWPKEHPATDEISDALDEMR